MASLETRTGRLHQAQSGAESLLQRAVQPFGTAYPTLVNAPAHRGAADGGLWRRFLPSVLRLALAATFLIKSIPWQGAAGPTVDRFLSQAANGAGQTMMVQFGLSVEDLDVQGEQRAM